MQNKKLYFSKWFVLQENAKAIEMQVAHFLEDILDRAVDLKKQDLLQNKSLESSTSYIKKVWPSLAIGPGSKFLFPETFPPDIAGKIVKFQLRRPESRAEVSHYNGSFIELSIDVTGFHQATTTQQLDEYLDAIKPVLHHEVEHIYNVGDDFDSENYDTHDEKMQGTFNYMGNEGELKAHARQMAYLYVKHFPGEPFDLNKAKTFLDHPGLNQTHRNYFDRLSQPDVWQKYVKKFNYTKNPYDSIMALMPQYVDQYNQFSKQP